MAPLFLGALGFFGWLFSRHRRHIDCTADTTVASAFWPEAVKVMNPAIPASRRARTARAMTGGCRNHGGWGGNRNTGLLGISFGAAGSGKERKPGSNAGGGAGGSSFGRVLSGSG